MSGLCLKILLLTWSCCSGFILDQVNQNINRHICYGDLGCFSTEPPFRSVERPVVLLPASPDSIQTTFELHTRSHPSTANEEKLSYNNVSSIRASSFDGSRKTKIIIHGFTHNGHRQWLQNMAHAFLKKEDMNIIIVDWGHGSKPPYTQASANTRVVGAEVAKLVNLIVSNDLSSMDKFHLIGHSLGAHIAGYAGERLKHLPRISGLDPADPYFQGTDVKVRLDPSDADFVDVIHTDDSSIAALGLGAAQAMGHVDFYPNGGYEQPGCPKDLLSKITSTLWNTVTQLDLLEVCHVVYGRMPSIEMTGKLGGGVVPMTITAWTTLASFKNGNHISRTTSGAGNITAGEGAVACSHERSYIYYTESILADCPFMAYPCSSPDEFAKGHCLRCDNGCSYMGYNSDKSSARGSMYLKTQDAAPFCNFHYQLNITGKNNMDGKLTVVLQGTKGNTNALSLMTDNEVHTQGHTFTKFITTSKDIGNVTAIAVRYDKTTSLLSGWAYPDTWQLLGVSLLEAETSRLSQFCAYGKSVQNHNAASFGIQGTC